MPIRPTTSLYRTKSNINTTITDTESLNYLSLEELNKQYHLNNRKIQTIRKENRILKDIRHAEKSKNCLLEELKRTEKLIHKNTRYWNKIKAEYATILDKVNDKIQTINSIKKETGPILTNNHPLTIQIKILENRLDGYFIKQKEATTVKKNTRRF